MYEYQPGMAGSLMSMAWRVHMANHIAELNLAGWMLVIFFLVLEGIILTVHRSEPDCLNIPIETTNNSTIESNIPAGEFRRLNLDDFIRFKFRNTSNSCLLLDVGKRWAQRIQYDCAENRRNGKFWRRECLLRIVLQKIYVKSVPPIARNFTYLLTSIQHIDGQ